ncbi:hypothetical protein Poli38472_010749 [Pythium oligandrum]|uniref:RRM domain-containing protein n=1 Tax=Pythium oligandrum TaxID=41045 RepID=A0A8K1CE09_PYTOL|nr:hypothetical protein Poli38472_010749 [Pythium oligandrum]|eukprot:TMW61686.1 hypothetical protein Poli38472_010749 [Pythium oligandrum]
MTKQIYVGNLPDDIIERTLDERFSKYGRIAAMHVKYPSRMPPFAYITYEKPRDAEDATHDMNGRPLNGSRVRVEVVDPREDGRHFRGTQFRVLLSDLPVSVEWQELKDHCRTAADVVTVEVDRRGNGVASFATHDEMERAIRALDQSEFRGERIRAKEDPDHGSRHLRTRHDWLSRSVTVSVSFAVTVAPAASSSLAVSVAIPLTLGTHHHKQVATREQGVTPRTRDDVEIRTTEITVRDGAFDVFVTLTMRFVLDFAALRVRDESLDGARSRDGVNS